MNNPLQRRKFLAYLGLGAASLGGVAIAAQARFPGASASDPLSLAKSASTEDFSRAIAANTPAQHLPEFQGIAQWLNSNPLTVRSLKGNVVLIQFWTFACINCQRTLPYITRWHRQYAAQGLRVVGVHTPEFAYERDVNNIKKALQQHQITYPVPIDNDFKTWSAYKNDYWPHLFLADRQGAVRYDHIGEGAYDHTEQTIRQLLG